MGSSIIEVMCSEARNHSGENACMRSGQVPLEVAPARLPCRQAGERAPKGPWGGLLLTGQAMLLTILTLGGAILGATTIAGLLMIYQLRQTTDSENSARAIFAADAGVECSLYDYFQSTGVAASAPVGYWPFDEGSGGTTADVSGNGNTGTLVGGPVWVLPGQVGSAALSFNGSTQVVTLGASAILRPAGAVTAAAWIKASAAQLAFPMIVTDGDSTGLTGYNLYLSNPGGQGVADFIVKDSGGWGTCSAPGTTNLKDNLWHHVAGVYNGTAIQIYVDGTLQNTVTCGAGPINYGASPAGEIAKKIDAGINDYFNGAIDDVRVYNTALSAAAIASLATGSSPPLATPCPLNANLTNNSHYTSTVDLGANTIFSQGLSGTARRSFLFFLSSATTTGP